MTKVTELAIRTKAAVQYPGWRVDFVGPATAVMTNIMGHRRMVTFRQRRRLRDEHPLMTAARWIIIATFWMFGMVVAATVVMALAMGVKL